MVDKAQNEEERGYREPAKHSTRSDADAGRWFIKQGEEEEKGPFTAKVIARSVRSGVLHRTSLVRAEHDSYWRPLHSVATLVSALHKPAPGWSDDPRESDVGAGAEGATPRTDDEPSAASRSTRWSKWAGACTVLAVALKLCRLGHSGAAEPKPLPVLDFDQPSIDISENRDLCVWDCEDRMMNRQQGLPFCTDLCARLPSPTSQATLKSGLDCLRTCQSDELDRLIAPAFADGGSPAKAMEAVKANAKDVTPLCEARCFTSLTPGAPEARTDAFGDH